MTAQWVTTFKGAVNTYTCTGCSEMCVIEGLEKPTTCIKENLFHEVQD
jgi:hypothetical protein